MKISFVPLLAFMTLTLSNSVQAPKATSKVDSFYESNGKSYFNGDVNIYEIGGDYTGHSIWLSRKGQRVKAKYFAYKLHGKTVGERFEQWKQENPKKHIISVCSGAFTTNDEMPHGIIIDESNLVNNNVDDKMDGLVIVEAIGGMRVSDLDKGNLFLQSLNTRVNVRSPLGKQTLVSWAKSEVATVFQTQMMYYDNAEKMGNQFEKRERRILVIGKQNNEVVYILFNLPRNASLTQASRDIFAYLKNRKGVNVIGMLNLDTGAKDYIEVFDESGFAMNHIKPLTPHKLSELSNLLVFYYE